MPSPLRLGAAVAAAALLLSGVAFAQAKLIATLPAAGGHSAAPGNLVLTFSEEISPMLSHVEIATAGGTAVAIDVALSQDRKTWTLTPKDPLTAGTYHVSWTVAASNDGHPTSGKYDFTID